MFVPVWTSRQVRTADCCIIVTARRRRSRDHFLLSRVCMSDLAWRRTEQAHRPIGSVGHRRIDQSEALGTSALTNQKRWANKRIDQSEASGTSALTNQKRRAQAHRPIRNVLKGQHKRTNHHRVSQSRESAAQPIRFVWQGALVDASSYQKELSDQPTRSIDRSNSDGLSSDGLSSD